LPGFTRQARIQYPFAMRRSGVRFPLAPLGKAAIRTHRRGPPAVPHRSDGTARQRQQTFLGSAGSGSSSSQKRGPATPAPSSDPPPAPATDTPPYAADHAAAGHAPASSSPRPAGTPAATVDHQTRQ